MVFDHTSHRFYPKATLAERVARNPAYSLRAMAPAGAVDQADLEVVKVLLADPRVSRVITEGDGKRRNALQIAEEKLSEYQKTDCGNQEALRAIIKLLKRKKG